MTEQLRRQESQPSPEQILRAGAGFLQQVGVEVDPTKQPEQFLDAMKQLDPRYEGGRDLVRYELAADQREWPEETKQVIMSTAESMGMLKPETPLVGNFDVVIALGGANQQNHERPRYALEAMKKGEASFGQLVIAGSSRKLKEGEQKNTANYAPGAETEFDLCVAGAAMLAKEYPGVPISVLLVDDEKAGTPDVIGSVLTSMQANRTLKPNSRVASVTTQIYQVSTELDLARVAKKFGITETHTAGIPSPAKTIEGRTPATYKSEVIRTLKAAVNTIQADAQEINTQYEATVRNQDDEEVHNNGDYTVYRDSQSGKEYIVVNESQEVEDEPQFIKAARVAGNIAADTTVKSSPSLSTTDEFIRHSEMVNNFGSDYADEDESNDSDKPGFTGYRQYTGSKDVEVGKSGHGTIYKDAESGENYLVGVDDNGRGYSEHAGLFYQDWNDPGTYDE